MSSHPAYELTRSCWGNYVAFICAGRGAPYQVIRDSSGRIPCYYTKQRAVYVFFSSIEDVLCLGLQFTLSESYVARFILHSRLPVRDTGLLEVTEVLAGESVTISSDTVAHTSLWDPWSTAAHMVIEDYGEARERLRRTTERVIGAWSSCYERILLNLSGGLDSAIVLGCLRMFHQSDRVTCVNHFLEGTSDDERAFAKMAAEAAGVRLIEVPRVCDGAAFFDRIHELPLEPKPDVVKLARILMIDRMNEVAQEFSCDTVWTGQGGDQIFLQSFNAFGAADYLALRKPLHSLLSVVYDSALVSRDSVWAVLLQAARCAWWGSHTRARRPTYHESKFLACAARNAIYESECSDRAWLGTHDVLPPGKEEQLYEIFALLNRHRPLLEREFPYEQHPLISQPLLELSLRIPTYNLLRGGRPRAMAREAFSDCVPAPILNRMDKGDTGAQSRALLRGSAHLLSDLLLGGKLESLGLLQRAPLERLLAKQETFRLEDFFPLFCCIAAEMWARRWSSIVSTDAV